MYSLDAHMLYMLLAMPALFGLSLMGEGFYKMTKYETGWGNMALGCLFLALVAFSYFYMSGKI